MADETQTEVQMSEAENGGAPETKEEAAIQSAKPEEKMISKAIYDNKIAEMNKTIKALKAEKLAKMSDEEKAEEEHSQLLADLKAAQNEAALLRTTSELISSGVNPEISGKIASAIIGGDGKEIVSSIKEALTAAAADASAKAKREMLESGAPKVGLTGSSQNGNTVDPNLERAKSAVRANLPRKTESPWLK